MKGGYTMYKGYFSKQVNMMIDTYNEARLKMRSDIMEDIEKRLRNILADEGRNKEEIENICKMYCIGYNIAGNKINIADGRA